MEVRHFVSPLVLNHNLNRNPPNIAEITNVEPLQKRGLRLGVRLRAEGHIPHHNHKLKI
jgi:hypothetical protein